MSQKGNNENYPYYGTFDNIHEHQKFKIYPKSLRSYIRDGVTYFFTDHADRLISHFNSRGLHLAATVVLKDEYIRIECDDTLDLVEAFQWNRTQNGEDYWDLVNTLSLYFDSHGWDDKWFKILKIFNNEFYTPKMHRDIENILHESDAPCAKTRKFWRSESS